MFDKVLVVCVGNICRSPTGEHLLKSMLPHKQIASAGIGTQKSGLVGKGADAMASELAKEHGMSLEGHKAQQLTHALCLEYDLILVMEKGHVDAVCQIAPEARGKTMLFAQWLDMKEIPDPYRKSHEAFEHAFELLKKSADSWVIKLK